MPDAYALRTLAQASLATAVLYGLTVAVSMWGIATGTESRLVSLGSTAVSLAALAFFIYVVEGFRRLLNARFGYHGADSPIRWLIIVNVAAAAVSLLGTAAPGLESGVTLVLLIAVVAAGVFTLILGRRLLEMEADLFGLGRALAYLCVVTGICLVVPLLVPLALVLEIAFHVLLAAVFKRASRSA
jgi:hypothetical protein